MTRTEHRPDPSPAEGTSWRERAVERSLRDARSRAETRSGRFLTAALELLDDSGRTDFTVQQLVERSGMSLRSFYQHFGSKDELLLALFEEALRFETAAWRALSEAVEDPLERLQVVVQALYDAPRSPRATSGSTRALAVFHLQLAEERPEEFAAVLQPLRALLVELVEGGIAQGAVRGDLGSEQLAVLLLQVLATSTILQILQDRLVHQPLTADQLWAFLRPALAGDALSALPLQERAAPV